MKIANNLDSMISKFVVEGIDDSASKNVAIEFRHCFNYDKITTFAALAFLVYHRAIYYEC